MLTIINTIKLVAKWFAYILNSNSFYNSIHLIRAYGVWQRPIIYYHTSWNQVTQSAVSFHAVTRKCNNFTFLTLLITSIVAFTDVTFHVSTYSYYSNYCNFYCNFLYYDWLSLVSPFDTIRQLSLLNQSIHSLAFGYIRRIRWCEMGFVRYVIVFGQPQTAALYKGFKRILRDR